MAESHSPMLLLLGGTASGKTAVSLALACRLEAEILSIDSMQVYRGMNIGTAKPTLAERERVAHHLIDVADPSESFSVARFAEMADGAIHDVISRGRRVLALAGTPLYLMGLMYGMFEGPSADEEFRGIVRERARNEGTAVLHKELQAADPEAASRIHPNDLRRIERALEVYHLTGAPLSQQQGQWTSGRMRHEAVIVGIRREREDQSRRINQRVRMMMEAGLVEEVRGLLSAPGGLGTQARQALGYAQIIEHLEGRSTFEEAVEQIKIQTRRFAKHQRTWFRRFVGARWLDVAENETAEETAGRIMTVIEDAGVSRDCLLAGSVGERNVSSQPIV